MFTVYKRKNIWLAFIVAILLIGVFAFAQVGARSTAKVRHLPLALVVNDSGASAQNVAHQLRRTNSHDDAKIKWITVQNQSSLTKGFANNKYYGALVIHSGFSNALTSQTTFLKGKVMTQKLTALATKTPAIAQTQPFKQKALLAKIFSQSTPASAKVSLYVSQGSNATVASLLTSALPQLVTTLNQQISSKYAQVATKANLNLSAQDWTHLQTPITSRLIKRNPISTKTINGMAPMIITILCWVGTLVASLMNWRDHRKFETRRSDGRLSLTSISSQLISGMLLATVIAGAVYFFTKICYGMPLPQPTEFLLLTGFISFVFYLIQSATLDLLGLKGWPLLLILWIGSMAVITFVPQMLSPFYRHYVYDWTPIRFAYDLFTKQMYLHDATLTGATLTTLLVIGLVAVGLMYGSVFLKRKPQTN